tara:strand:+ start:817 stop:996 length:180 start_codon:yes stop_codon:yes gene_type:complete
MDKEMNELWDYITEYEIATENEIALITSINGTNLDTFESILFSRTGYRSLDQIKEMEDY